MASAKVKVEPEKELQPSTSGGGEQIGEVKASDFGSDEFDDEYITEYCETVDMSQAMTISKEPFYIDAVVARCYEWLSDEDKARFDQMKVLPESVKQETGDYHLIEDLMA